MRYIVYKIAVVNPSILGETLYLTYEGRFSLKQSDAVRFRVKKLAQQRAAEHPGALVRRVFR